MYVVVNIGCIECGVSSNIVGVFKSEQTANSVAQQCIKKYDWREGGQNDFEVFELPEEGSVNDEYSEVSVK